MGTDPYNAITDCQLLPQLDSLVLVLGPRAVRNGHFLPSLDLGRCWGGPVFVGARRQEAHACCFSASGKRTARLMSTKAAQKAGMSPFVAMFQVPRLRLARRSRLPQRWCPTLQTLKPSHYLACVQHRHSSRPCRPTLALSKRSRAFGLQAWFLRCMGEILIVALQPSCAMIWGPKTRASCTSDSWESRSQDKNSTS